MQSGGSRRLQDVVATTLRKPVVTPWTCATGAVNLLEGPSEERIRQLPRTHVRSPTDREQALTPPGPLIFRIVASLKERVYSLLILVVDLYAPLVPPVDPRR
ncbi:MAG: hypothetical protein ACOC1I_06375 [Spirochaetota bacterium]